MDRTALIKRIGAVSKQWIAFTSCTKGKRSDVVTRPTQYHSHTTIPSRAMLQYGDVYDMLKNCNLVMYYKVAEEVEWGGMKAKEESTELIK